VSNIKML